MTSNRKAASGTQVEYGSVVFGTFTDMSGKEHDLTFDFIKSPLVTPAPKSLLNKKKVTASSLLADSTHHHGTGDKVETMKDWVVMRLQNMPDDVKVTSDAATKFVEISNTVVRSVKSALKSQLHVSKLKSDDMNDIEKHTAKFLSMDDGLDTSSSMGLAIPAHLLKDSDTDMDIAAFLGVVLGNYLETYIFQPTFDRTKRATAEGKKVEVTAANAEYTRKLWAQLHGGSK